MEMISAAFFAFVLVVASNGNPIAKDEPVDTAENFIHCVHIALDTGLPAADLPPHNPLVIQEPWGIEIPVEGVSGPLIISVGLSHAQIDGILDYNFTQLEGQMVTDDDGIQSAVLNYAIYWPDININGVWYVGLDGEKEEGTYAVHLKDVTVAGIWDMVISGQDVPRQMNNVTIDLVVGSVESEISNSAVIDVTGFLNAVLSLILNSIPTETSSELLKNRLDTFWFGHPERIDAIIDNCKNNGKH